MFALVFLVLFGLLIAALLSQVDVHFKMTGIVRDDNAKLNAANAGVDYGIRVLHDDATRLCQHPSLSVELQILTTTIGALASGAPDEVSGTVGVTCRTLLGAGLGARGYGLVTLDPGALSLGVQSGGDKTITGTVYVAGGLAGCSGNAVCVSVKLGNTYQEPDPVTHVCPSQHPESTPPYRWICPPTVLRPVPDTSLPVTATAVPGAITPTASGCRVFYPGKYHDTSLNLTGPNYFVSGVYRFVNATINVMNGSAQNPTVVFGGLPARNQERQVTTLGTACSNDVLAGRPGSGTGVEFILEGGSSIVVGGASTALELYARQPQSPFDASERSAGISLYIVPPQSAGSPWVANTNDVKANSNLCTRNSSTGCALVALSGQPQEALHGYVYGPNAGYQVFATQSSAAQSLGGAYVYRALLKSSASATGLITTVTRGKRTVLVRARARGTQGGERPVLATAIVLIPNDPLLPPRILSWRTT